MEKFFHLKENGTTVSTEIVACEIYISGQLLDSLRMPR